MKPATTITKVCRLLGNFEPGPAWVSPTSHGERICSPAMSIAFLHLSNRTGSSNRIREPRCTEQGLMKLGLTVLQRNEFRLGTAAPPEAVSANGS